MIQVKNISDLPPYKIFLDYYNNAVKKKEANVEAIAISSFNKELNYVDSRFVNIKFIEDDKWIFFTNYKSSKAKQFLSHNQIAGLFFWKKINVQIRIKAKVSILNKVFSDDYFKQRSNKKNALAICSSQSESIDSYQSVINNYKQTLQNENLKLRPDSWGGYFFHPYEFEFWEGHESRINKRVVYSMINGLWKQSFLQP